MWHIKLVDIGGDGLVTECNSSLDTLAELEILIEGSINQHLGVHSCRLEHTEELVYSVWVDGIEVGVVVIKDVNSAPIKRKRG